MKLSICLIGEDSLALASLKQELEKDVAFHVEPRVYSYGEALEGLRNKTGPVIVVVDLNCEMDGAFGIVEDVKLNFSNFRLLLTSPSSTRETILREMLS